MQVIIECHAVPGKNTSDWISTSKVWGHPHLRRIVTISRALADDLVAEYGPPHQGCDIVVAHDGAEAGGASRPHSAA